MSLQTNVLSSASRNPRKRYFFHKSTHTAQTANRVAISLYFGKKGILEAQVSIKGMNVKNMKASFTDHCFSRISPILLRKIKHETKNLFMLSQ